MKLSLFHSPNAPAALMVILSSLFAIAQHPQSKSSAITDNDQQQGKIHVRVVDPTGAVFTWARVTLLNLATQQTIRMNTDSTGCANLSALPPGAYVLSASAPGFEEQRQIFDVGKEPLDVNMTLSPSKHYYNPEHLEPDLIPTEMPIVNPELTPYPVQDVKKDKKKKHRQ